MFAVCAVSFPLYLDLEVCETFVTAESVAKSPQFPEHFPPTSHFDFGFQEELSEAVFRFPGNKARVLKRIQYICHNRQKFTIHAWEEWIHWCPHPHYFFYIEQFLSLLVSDIFRISYI